ncbi:hypothetical protein QOZ80_3AG0250910 [Eleusine coracana subsp. coracana]|nr:hypothetical protein QOZ80_3AG0250910 [Eleusine coracana subsp. coracana]
MAHAALPGLLPTPPLCAAIIVPSQSPPNKPAGRADAVDRWDACKNTLKSPPNKPGRADATERWDARKITAQASIPASVSSSGHMSSPSSEAKKKSSSASSCARWDSDKKKSATSSSSSSSSSNRSCPARWDSNKRPVISRGCSSSAERWDAHKKPRPPLANDDGPDVDDGDSSTGSNEYMEADDTPQPKQTGIYAGPGFLAPPDPRMLPLPSFLLLPRFVAA